MINSMNENRLSGAVGFQNRVGLWWTNYRKKSQRVTPMAFVKLTEEVGEASGCYYRGETKKTYGNKAGAPHPEGLGSELADVVIMAFIIASRENIDLGADIDEKVKSLEARLAHKEAKKSGKRG